MDDFSIQAADNDEPLYNIGAVSRMTKIAETTLRAWERRYNFPESARSPGGHRLYSQVQVLRVQWVKQRMDEGMQVSQAIRALEHAEREGLSMVALHSPITAPARSDPGTMTELRRQILQALLAHEIARADEILGMMQATYPLETIILEIIGPVLADIGMSWADERIDVATEHFATHHLRQLLTLWRQTGGPPHPVRPVVLSCAPGELHEGSALMLSVLLRRLRWPVVYLGATMPLEDLDGFLNDTQPAVLVFVAMRDETAGALLEWPGWLPGVEERNDPIVCFGGRAFNEHPDFADQMPGMFLGQTLEEGIDRLNRLMIQLNPQLR